MGDYDYYISNWEMRKVKERLKKFYIKNQGDSLYEREKNGIIIRFDFIYG